MKRIKQWVNGLSVKKKLILYGYLIIAPVLFVLCGALVLYNYHNELESRLQEDIMSVNALAENVQALQDDIKNYSTYICINNDINTLLCAEEVEELNQNAKLWLEEAPMQILQDMIALNGTIKTIGIYPENGLRPYLRCMDGSSYIQDVESIKESEIYQEVLRTDNGILWKNVAKNEDEVYMANRSDKVVLFREIRDLAKKRILGYVVIGVEEEGFCKLSETMTLGTGEGLLILDKFGGILSKTGNIPGEIEQHLLSDDFMNQNYRTRKRNFIYGDYNIICQQKTAGSSIVCKVAPRYNLQMQLKDFAYIPITLLIGFLVGLLPLLTIISNIVTRPLRQVSEAIQQVSTGDFKQRVEVRTKDEVGEVARCFNKMVDDIGNLINENYVITLKERESELLALQAQINPHFLYNTLDSLYWQATEAENEEIAESILALSQLFRLVLNQGKEEVAISQEMELVSRYLQIQKMRFSKRLHYTILVDEEIKKVHIPKLIIQPFVENAIVHGFENVSTPCMLTVAAKAENDRIRFEIRDSGIGMRQDQIDAIWEEENTRYARQRIGKYAIKNVRERLELRYHERFELCISSDVGKGTTVVIYIPFEKEEKPWQ